MRSDFQICHDRARSRLGESAWDATDNHERAAAIYVEIRAFDLARLAAWRRADEEHARGRERMANAA